MTRFIVASLLMMSLSIILAGCNCCEIRTEKSSAAETTTQAKHPQQDDLIDLYSVYDLSDRMLDLEGGAMRLPEERQEAD